MEQGNITDVLLVKYLLGEVSDTERRSVQNWLAAGGENKKRFYELKLVWDQSRKAMVKTSTSAEEAWERLKRRMANKQGASIVIPVHKPDYSWLKVAAVLLLLVGGGLLWYMNVKDDSMGKHAAVNLNILHKVQNTSIIEELPKQIDEVKIPLVEKPFVPKEVKRDKYIATKKDTKINVAPPDLHGYGAKKYICNGTPCPLEICITQSVKCHGDKSASYSTCSTLEPDESGQLSLKMGDKLAPNCSQSIKEIRITRLTTGESIVLDANSTPATAQDLYNYITGQKKGNILAGVFHADCDNEESDHILSFDNDNYGHLILQ